jgi:NOL1/NOP2/sun family putative RNA methylase
MYSEFLLRRYESLFPGEIPHLDKPLPQAIRVNTLRTGKQELVERLTRKGIILEEIPWTMNGYTIKKAPFSMGATTEYLLGYYFIQDPTSMYACEVLEPKAGEVVLDMAAAPGGKTTYLAQLMGNRGGVVALELSRERMKSLRSNVSRLGVENVIAVRMNALDAAELGIEFDRVLLDAPCTGTGTAFKNPEAKNKGEDDVKKCTTNQRALLETAAGVLKKGGAMVYCTCSLLPEENEFMVQYALKELGLELKATSHGKTALTSAYGKALTPEMMKARRFYPGIHRTQGFFIAKMIKI